MNGIDAIGDYRVLLLPDHPTPVEKMTHTKDPVPFVLAGSGVIPDSATDYSEVAAKASGMYINPGHHVMELLVKGKLS